MLFPVFSHTTILPLIREERPYHGDYHNGYHEADDDKTGAALDEVHEGILARAKNESIRRSTYRTCESTEDAIRIAMRTARGDAPTWAAKAMPTGQRSALEAVLLMNCVRTTARMKSTAVMT